MVFRMSEGANNDRCISRKLIVIVVGRCWDHLLLLEVIVPSELLLVGCGRSTAEHVGYRWFLFICSLKWRPSLEMLGPLFT